MNKIYCDGSKTQTCFYPEGSEPVVQGVDTLGLPMTHNENEYRAIMRALHWAFKQGWKEVTVISDSQLAIRQLTRKPNGTFVYAAKEKRMRHLRDQVLSMAREFDKVEFQWVPREENKAGKVLEGKK